MTRRKDSNPLNPLNWLTSAQDWFARTEKSSGFRPYLIYLILVFGMASILLACFNEIPGCSYLAIALVGSSAVVFMVSFSIKIFQDPDFARSETHIQRMKKLESETMGTESEVVEGEVVEQQLLNESTPERPQFEDQTDEPETPQ